MTMKMTIDEWIQSRFLVFEIPSGLTVKVKKADIYDIATSMDAETLALAKIVPSDLQVDSSGTVENTFHSVLKQMMDANKLVTAVCKSVMIEPTYDEVGQYLSFSDKDFIANQALGAAVAPQLKSDTVTTTESETNTQNE